MKYSLELSNFLEYISSLSQSIVLLYFFSLFILDPKPHQTNPADLTLILGVLLKTLYYKALQPQLTGPFEVVLTIPQLLNWHVFTHHFVKMKVKVAQSCLTLCDPMDYTVPGILQARILEWVAFPFSRGSSQPRDQTQVSCIAGRFFTS